VAKSTTEAPGDWAAKWAGLVCIIAMIALALATAVVYFSQ
jgi:hypothetical protein